MIDTETRRKFIAHYKARYGRFPAEKDAEQMAIWGEWIDRLTPSLVEQAVELMGLGREDRRTLPLLDDLKRAVQKLLCRYMPEDKASDCVLCYGSGLICVPAAGPTADRPGWVIGDPTKSVLHETAFPCRCAEGRERAKRMRVPPDVAKRALDYLEAVRKECGEDDVRGLTLRQYLAAESEGYSARTLMAQAIVDSLRMDAARKGLDTSAFPALPAQRTAESLRTRIAQGKRVEAAAMPRPVHGDLEPIGDPLASLHYDDPEERAAIQGE
jgi:hypothetical protein